MKEIILTVVLATGLVGTATNWALAHEKNKSLNKDIEKQELVIAEKSTEIANLEAVIVEKDKELVAQNLVIEEQKNQLQVLNEEIEILKKKIEEQKRTITVNSSAYISMCREGCSGITRSGYDVRNTIYYQGMRIIATDLSVIPMYSIVEIEGFDEQFIVLDTGGGIKGNKIDILVDSTETAIKFGRKNLKLTIIREGKGE